MNGGGGTGSSHEDMRLSRLYQQLIEWQEPRFRPEYDLAAGLEQYRAWMGQYSEVATRQGTSPPAGSGVAQPASPDAADADEELGERGPVPVSVAQALVAASGAFQAPLTGGMEWRADLAVMELYAQHYRALVRLAAMLVRDMPTAEEVVQDAFVAMHDGWHRLKATEKALAYLRQAVVNKSRSVLRHRMVVEKNLQGAPPDMPSAEHGAFVLLERSAVIAALRDLPARQREAIVLRYYADLSEAEIAAAMGISRGAVKSHTARGMAALRAALEQELWPAPAPAPRALRHGGTALPSSCVVRCTTRRTTSSRRQTAWNRFAPGSRAMPGSCRSRDGTAPSARGARLRRISRPDQGQYGRRPPGDGVRSAARRLADRAPVLREVVTLGPAQPGS